MRILSVISQTVCGLLFIFKTHDGSLCLSSRSLQVSGHDWTAWTSSSPAQPGAKPSEMFALKNVSRQLMVYPFKCRLAVVRAHQGEARSRELPHAQRGAPKERDGDAVQDQLQAGLRGAELRGGVHGQQTLVVQLRLPRFENSHSASCLILSQKQRLNQQCLSINTFFLVFF